MLSRAGLWERRPSDVALRCASIASAWEQSSLRVHSFLSNPYGPAWHLDRARFDAWLMAEAIAEGVAITSATARGAVKTPDGWIVELGDGSNVQCSYIIVATGRTGTFATSHARRTRLDDLCMLGGFSAPVGDADDRLLIEAVSSGWWYSIAVPDGRIFAGWVTSAKNLKSSGRDIALASSFAETIHTRARVHSLQDTIVRPAMSSILDTWAGDGWIAIGDAAFSRDPLSGEGLAAAVRSGWDGAETVIAELDGDRTRAAALNARAQGAARHYLDLRSAAYATHARGGIVDNARGCHRDHRATGCYARGPGSA